MILVFSFIFLASISSLVECFSPNTGISTTVRPRSFILSYRTGDEEMDKLINAPAVEYLEYRRAIFNPRNRQQNIEKAMEKRKFMEYELVVGRSAMVLFFVMILHELITGENIVHTFLYGP